VIGGAHIAYEEFARSELGEEDREFIIRPQQLYECLDAAESMVDRPEALGEQPMPPGLKKRKRLESPTDHITSSDEQDSMRMKREL
jgi:hypothetical protein